MADTASVGSIVGYLKLDKSDWDAEIAAANGQAKDLGRSNPKINIETNAPAAIAQLELVAAATKRLQDAQGRESTAQLKVNDLESAGVQSGTKLATAKEALAKASRDVELSQIRLAKAYSDTDNAASDLGRTAESAGFKLSDLFAPAIGVAPELLGALAAVGAVGGTALGVVALGAKGLSDTVESGLTPAFDALEQTATDALGPGIRDAVTHLQSALPQLQPLITVFGNEIGRIADEFSRWLDDGGIKSFVTYAETELPIVERLAGDSTVAIGNLFKDTQGSGNNLLNDLDSVVKDLNQVQNLANKIGSIQIHLPFGAAAESLGSFLGDINSGPTNALSWLSNLGGGGSKTPVLPDAKGATADMNALGESSRREAADMLDAAASTMAAENQVSALAKTLPTANVSLQGLLASMATYAKSAGTVADKSQLLGGVLKASQGDALSYQGAIAQGYDAFNQLSITFQQQTKDSQLGVTAFRDTEKAAIDLNTGLINLKATGAAPLIQQLQAMQDAAEQAAEATYQHEVATKGDSTALADAQTIFESMTRGTLVDNASQLGLTKDQAQKLADQYFAMPANVTTEVQSVGLNDINSTLDQIGQQLAVLTGKPWVVDLTLSAKTLGGITLHDVVNDIPAHADGGYVSGSGGPRSDSILSYLSNGEYVMPAAQTAMYRQQLEAMRSGTPMGAASPAGGGSFHVTVNSVLDGKVLATSTNQVNMNNGRRS